MVQLPVQKKNIYIYLLRMQIKVKKEETWKYGE